MSYYPAETIAPSCTCVQDAVEYLDLLGNHDSEVWASNISRAKARAQQYAAVPACPWLSIDCYHKYALLIFRIAELYLTIIQKQQSRYELRIGDFTLSCTLSLEDRRRMFAPELEEFNSVVIQQFLECTEDKGDAVMTARHNLLEARRLVAECLHGVE